MSWQDDIYFYWANDTNPMVALTSTAIAGIDHATGTVTGLQIGDQTGILPALCTGFITAGTCPEQQNCIWCRDHKNVTSDRLLFVAGRPLSLGITYVASGVVVGTLIVWFSTVAMAWITGTVNFVVDEAPASYADGMTATIGSGIFSGQQAVSGDSGSPVFTLTGEFVGSVSGLAGADTVFAWAYPSGSQTRPAVANTFSGSIYDYEEL